MAITLTNAGSRITANAANVATQMGGGTTTAEATMIGALLTILSRRPDLAQPPASLLTTTDGQQIVTPG
jgi:hypothetical protein